MTERTHRCRRSCEARVARDKAFCSSCWRRVPKRVQRAVYASWGRYKREEIDLYDHVELLRSVEDALEGDRPWESVAPA